MIVNEKWVHTLTPELKAIVKLKQIVSKTKVRCEAKDKSYASERNLHFSEEPILSKGISFGNNI